MPFGYGISTSSTAVSSLEALSSEASSSLEKAKRYIEELNKLQLQENDERKVLYDKVISEYLEQANRLSEKVKILAHR